MKKFNYMYTVILLFSFCFISTASSQSFKIAIEEADTYPWSMNDGSGVDRMLIQKAADIIGAQVEFVSYPWKRCLASLQNNSVDGIVSASYKAKRIKIGAYPMTAEGTPDASKRLHSSSYSLYVKNDSNLSWTGDNFINLTGKIGVPAGYSIIEKIKSKGATITEVSSTENLMKMLARGRITGVVTLTAQGEYALSKDSASASKIKLVTPPLVEKPYYLMLSHKLLQENATVAKKLWDTIQSIRDSDDYKKMYDTFMAK